MKNWKENLKKGKEITVASCDKNNNPHANIVISLGFLDDKLLIADCQMQTTLKNLEKNNKVCLIGGYCRAKGTIEIFNSGKYFEICSKEAKESGFEAKNAILISIEEAFDLDKCEKLEIK